MLTCRNVRSSVRTRIFFAASLLGIITASAQQLDRNTVIAEVLKSTVPQGSSTRQSAAAPAGLTSETDTSAAERLLGGKMSNAERVNIRIPGYPVLSGEYRINGDGTLSLPGIGRLEIGEMTIAEFEKQLALEISGISNRDISVAIEVVDYRPVFVSGVVARSGSFPWKPGITVLHAETLAGGLFRGSATGDDGVVTSSTDRERERAVRAAYDLAAALALITRLKTERSNGSTFALPARVASLISKSEQESLAAAQLATLQSRNTVFANRVTSTENTKALAVKKSRL
jgi:protein involved in polysaccharide export with SLBB domain